jgi:hypothetical protein
MPAEPDGHHRCRARRAGRLALRSPQIFSLRISLLSRAPRRAGCRVVARVVRGKRTRLAVLVSGLKSGFVPACGRTEQGASRAKPRGSLRRTESGDKCRRRCPPCPAPAPPPRDPSGIARSSSSRLANASGRDTASVHAVLPFGIHASPSLVVACDDELRPCARTCAPCTPRSLCRSSAAVTGPCHTTRHPWLVDFAIRQAAYVATFAVSEAREERPLLDDPRPASASKKWGDLRFGPARYRHGAVARLEPDSHVDLIRTRGCRKIGPTPGC